MGLIGIGVHPTLLFALGAINMMVWSNTGGGGDPANRMENIKFDGNNVALSGCIVGYGQSFVMNKVMILELRNDGLVLCQTQNSKFNEVFVTGCGLSNYRLAGTAWNNDFSRCGSNSPGSSGYHLCCNSTTYNALIAGGALSLSDNRHNIWYHPVFERGTPVSIIQLEDDDGDNCFYSMELEGGSTGGVQVYIGSSASSCTFMEGIVGRTDQLYAFDNYAFGIAYRSRFRNRLVQY